MKPCTNVGVSRPNWATLRNVWYREFESCHLPSCEVIKTWKKYFHTEVSTFTIHRRPLPLIIPPLNMVTVNTHTPPSAESTHFTPCVVIKYKINWAAP